MMHPGALGRSTALQLHVSLPPVPTGHFGSVYHGTYMDPLLGNLHCAVKSLHRE